jgi:hypothetical protein
VNSNLILERDDSQKSSLELVDLASKSIPVSLLDLASQRLFQNSNAPFLFQIWPLAQDLLLEILGKPIFRHV